MVIDWKIIVVVDDFEVFVYVFIWVLYNLVCKMDKVVVFIVVFFVVLGYLFLDMVIGELFYKSDEVYV